MYCNLFIIAVIVGRTSAVPVMHRTVEPDLRLYDAIKAENSEKAVELLNDDAAKYHVPDLPDNSIPVDPMFLWKNEEDKDDDVSLSSLQAELAAADGDLQIVGGGLEAEAAVDGDVEAVVVHPLDPLGWDPNGALGARRSGCFHFRRTTVASRASG